MKKSLQVLLAFVLFAFVFTLAAVPVGAKPSRTVEVQILALNDFHGNLLPPGGSAGRVGTIDAGGVEYLATHVNNLRALNPNTVVVSAGDMIGASPLLSALFHDEPTIEAFNLIGLDFNAVGNHEFDEGIDELLRMQKPLRPAHGRGAGPGLYRPGARLGRRAGRGLRPRAEPAARRTRVGGA